jgi:putative flippase GtrA
VRSPGHENDSQDASSIEHAARLPAQLLVPQVSGGAFTAEVGAARPTQKDMSTSSTSGRQVARFAATGVLNTLIDYLLFMLLTWILALPLSRTWSAKAISGTVAMINSFILNRRWVFRGAAGGPRQLARFLAVTLFGTFVVQLGGIRLLTSTWLLPGELVVRLVSALHLDALLPRAFVVSTFAFGVATLASMTWNFLAYRRWVFPVAQSRDAAAPGAPAGPASSSSSSPSPASPSPAAAVA